jgi:3-phenylpropionate/cinnamic acid dioxygenase small subunit
MIDTVTKKRRKRKTRTKIEMTIDIGMKKDGTTINMKKNTKIERRIRKRTKMTKDEIKMTEKRKMIGKIEMKRRTETEIRFGLLMTIRCSGVSPL